jgi:filamentous hemagglutinin family protein
MRSHYSKTQRLIAALTNYFFIFANIVTANFVYAEQIVPDGRTQTQLNIQGNVTDIKTSTIHGINAYNSFNKFNVNSGNIANLHVPGSATNLLNLVHDQASSIDGILNAYKNGSVGGNVFFANPHGIVVGASGLVNVGSLTVSTPTASFMSGFYDASGNPTNVSTNQLLNSTAPINDNALISIRGRVNALDAVVLQAGDIINTGVINVGATALQAIHLSGLVNTDNLQTGAGIVEKNGEIFIMAENDFVSTGDMSVDGASNIDAGNVEVTAKNNITLAEDSRISAKGQGENSNGGNVVVFADNLSTLKDNASLDVTGGEISGDGGFIEFSAKDTVEIGGGSLQAGAINGKQGTILIDPLNVNITQDLLRNNTVAGGTDDTDSKGSTWNAGKLTLEADEKITIAAGIVVSTRHVAGNTVDAHKNDDSTGSSANLTLNAKEIELKAGAMLLAHVQGLDDNHKAGDIELNAKTTDHSGLTTANAITKIVVDGATIKANNINLLSSSEALYDWGGDTDDLAVGLADIAGGLGTTGLRAIMTQLTGINIGVAIARGESSIILNNGSVLEAADTVSLNSETKAAASTYTIAKPAAAGGAFAVGIVYGETKSHATVDIQSGVTINAADLSVDARNTADLNLNVYAISTSDSKNAAVAIGHADVKSVATIAAGANINVSKKVSIEAVNNDRMVVASTALAIEGGQAGLSASFLFADDSATAYSNANINSPGLESLTIHALDNNVKNRVTSSTDAGSGVVAKNLTKYAVKGINSAANTLTSGFLETRDAPPGATSKPKFAGALSYVESTQAASASIGNDAVVVASKDVTVTAKVEDARLQNHAASTVASEHDEPTADNPSATIGVSVAVSYGDYTHNADAHIGDNAHVTAQHVGVRSDVLMPWEQTWWKWEGLTSIISKLNGNLGVANGFLTGYANAQSAGEDFALAGAITWLDFNNNSTAYLGESSEITILPGGTSNWISNRTNGIGQFVPITDINVIDEPACALTLGCTKLKFVDETVNWNSAVNVIANNEIEGVYSSGNLGITLKGVGGETGGKAVGASFNQIDYNNTTRAFIAEGAKVKQQAATAAVDINVIASSRENMIVVSPTAGRGASFGLNGQVSIAQMNNTTEASIDDEAQVSAKNLTVKASDEVVTWSLSGAFNMSDTAAVGIAVAYTDVTSRTNAFLGDNDINLIAGSSLSLTDGEITANDIVVNARTDGRIESFAVAATLASSSKTEFERQKNSRDLLAQDKPKTGLSKWLDAASGLISGTPKKSGANDPAASTYKPKFGVGISGAAAVNLSDLDTSAYIKHPVVTGVGSTSTLNVSAVNDTDITAAAGAAALTRANAPSAKRSAAFAGAVTVNVLTNDTSAYIDSSAVTNVNDVDVIALEGGEQLSIAIGAAVNASAKKSSAASVAGSVSVSEVENTVRAYIKDSTLKAPGSGNRLNVIAYDRTKLGTGAGSLFAGGKAGFGAAITYSEIENTAEAYIENSSITDSATGDGDYNNIAVQAYTASQIAAGGGMVGITTASEGASLAGAVVVNDIDNTVSAEIRGNSTVTASSKVDVLARDINAIASLDTIIDSEDNGYANASSLDYDGTTIGLDSPSGSSILAVAGVVQLGLNGGNNVGASLTRNTISNKFFARITDSVVTTQANGTVTGDINVIARSDAKITGIAAGLGFASGKFAGAGSVTSNEIDNEVRAEISSTSIQKISTNRLNVTAEDKSKIESLAGQVTISTGATAIGLSLAHNEINNKVFSSVTGVDIDARQITDVSAENASTIRTLSATAGGSKDLAFNGAVSIGLIGNETEAKIVNSKANTTGNQTDVTAKDRSTIEALSGGAAVALKGAGVGIAVAVNRIAGSTKAHVSDSAAASQYNLKGLKVLADSQATINTISVGIGGGKDVGIGGSITTNFIDNDVWAYIDDGAKVIAQNNVAVLTESDDRLTVAAGSAGIGLGSAGIGVSFAYNDIKGSAKAYIEGTGTGTEVSAYAKSAIDKLTMNTGLLDSSVDLGKAVDLDTYNKLDLRSKKEKQDVTGVAVNASSTQHVESIGANLAAGYSAGLGLVTTLNNIAGSTEAYIQNATVNGDNTDGTSRQDINVIASNHAYGNGFVGNLSIAVSGAAAGAAVDTHSISRHTRAFVNGGLLKTKGDLTLKAYTTQGVSSLAVGGSAGANALAGTLVYANFINTTEAFISNTNVTADEVSVDADNENNLNLVAGAVSVGGNAAGGAFTVGLNESKTNAYITGADTPSYSYRTKINASGGVRVTADAKTNINQKAIAGAAAGSIGVAGSVAVNILNSETQAYIKDADVGSNVSKAGAVTVSANDNVEVDTTSGAVAIGLTAGVGASVAVNILKSRVTSSINNAGVYSSSAVGVTANSKNNIDVTTVTGGGGFSAGISGAVVVNLVGSDVVDTTKGGDEANDEAGGTIKGVDDAISDVGDTIVNDILPGGDAILTSAETVAMKNSTGGDVKDISYGQDAAAAKYQTSANILGADSVINAASLEVAAKDSTSSKTTVGGVGVGALGAGAGVGVSKIKANVIAHIDTGVDVDTTGNIDVKAIAKKDTGEVINILAFAGAGGLVGLGAAVAVADVNNNVSASNDGDTDSVSGTVNVEATDSSNMLIESLGAVVGAAAGGAVIARATKTSVVTASSGASTVNASGASIKAKSEGEIIARTQSAAGGLFGAGNGSDARATDNSTVIASTADFSTFNLGTGTLAINAEASPQVDALAEGVTVSGGLAVGVSIAKAEATVNVIASLGRNNRVNAGNLNIAATQTLGSFAAGSSNIPTVTVNPCVVNCASARATAFAASGGLLLGANATIATTLIDSDIRTLVGADSELIIVDQTTISAMQKSDQYAATKSFAAGIAAKGGADSAGTSNILTEIRIADGVNITAANLTLSANGDITNRVKSKSGSGGGIAGASAVASTDNLSVTQILLGNGTVTATNMDVDAMQTTSFDHEADSTSGGLLGASGAVADHSVDAQVAVTLAGTITAEMIGARARNIIKKNMVTGFNINAGAGGLLGGAAADSKTVINRMASTVKVAGDSTIIVKQDGDDINGNLVLEARNDLVADDRAKLDSGGAIAIALAETSFITAGEGISAKVDIGEGAITETYIEVDGDIIAAALSNVDVRTSANASTYGLAGAAQGQSTSTISLSDSVNVRALTAMRSGAETRLYAGRAADDTAAVRTVLATTDLWNKTAFPVENDPEADAFLSNLNAVTVESNAVVGSVGNIYLTADKGVTNVLGVGTGKDLYRQAAEDTVNFFGDLVGADDVSFDITGGSSIHVASEAVTVAGLVNAGIDNKLKFEIRRATNGDLLFYEGEWSAVEGAEETYFEGLTPTLTLHKELAGYTATDSESHSWAVDYDGGTGLFTIDESDDGLSTAVTLQADFDPLEVLNERLVDIGTELNILNIDAGSYTAAEIEQRTAFENTSRNALSEVITLERLKDSIQDINSSTNVATSFAGYNQLIGTINTVTAKFDSEYVATSGDLTAWNLQVAGLNQLETRIDDASGLSSATKTAIKGDIGRQRTEVQSNLLDTSAGINTAINLIKSLQADTAANSGNKATNDATISTLRGDIAGLKGTINAYKATLTSRVSTIGSDIVQLQASSDSALASLAGVTGSGSTATALAPAINRLEQEQTWISRRIAEYDGGSGYKLIDFTDKLNARSADIFVDSAVLVGAENLVANRDTEISIHNQTDAYLRISGGAEIPFAAGGGIYHNRSRLNPNDDGFSKIELFNLFTPSDLDAPGPDLIVSGDVSNFGGLAHLWSVTGGVQTGDGAKVYGNEVRIEAGRDVILSYTGGITHAAGDVKCVFDVGQDCTHSDIATGIVAGNSVMIAGEYLNINGNVQSGYEELELEISPDGSSYGIWKLDADGNRYLFNDNQNGPLVFHAAVDDIPAYFELKPQRIAGGYIDLYGHIISTAGESRGSLNVMDGYGRVKLTNNSNYKVMVDGISAGTGVVGKIRITDLDHDLAGKNNTKTTTYTYDRFATDGRPVHQTVDWEKGDAAGNPFNTNLALYQNSDVWFSESGLAYQPLADQYYSWENIQAKGYFDFRDVERETYFGLFEDTTKAPKYSNRTSEPTTSGDAIKDELIFVFSDAARAATPGSISGDVNGDYFNSYETVGTEAGSYRKIGSIDTDEYVVYRSETWKERRSRTNYDYTKHFVQASKPIGINFTGFSEGKIDLLSTGTGGWDIQGDLRNASGITNIVTAGAVRQTDANALISARQLGLVGSSFGAYDAVYSPLRIDITDGGRLNDIVATGGDIVLQDLYGDFRIGNITALNGDVWLASAGNILNDTDSHPGNDNVVTGQRVNLRAELGSIGNGNGDFIRVDSLATAEGGIDAIAADEIVISEIDGDLYLRRANASGNNSNVFINVGNGSLVDNNLQETKDTRTIDQLLGLWNEMEFLTDTTGDNGVNSAGNVSATYNVGQINVEAQEELKTREYQTYWSYRSKLRNPSEPVTNTTIVLSGIEAASFSDPDAVAAQRSAEFARLDELYGNIGNTYDDSYRYQVVVDSAENSEYSTLTKRAGWTELELLASFGPGLLKEISDTEIRIEDANVSASNINITVQNGNIGTYKTDDILIDLVTVADYTELTDAQKLALLTAERNDVRFDETSYDDARKTYMKMYISTFEDVDVDVADTLSVTAATAERIYIGSENDLNISGIIGLGDVRVRTNGYLTGSAADGIAEVVGKDIILESGSQSIGSEDDLFRISQLIGGSLTARAGNNIWLEAINDDLAIDTVFSKNLFTLKTAGDVVEYTPDTGVDVRADSVVLEISGSFGVAGDLANSIDVALNPEGILTATIDGGAWITSPNRDLRIGSFEVGASSRIVGNGNLNFQSKDGSIVSTGGTLTLKAGGSIVDEDNDGARTIEALGLDMIASTGDIGDADNFMNIDVSGSQGVWAQAENGSIYIESPDSDMLLRNVTAGDTSTLTSGGDILLIQSADIHSTGGTLSIEAENSILDESGDSQFEVVKLSLQANNGSIGSAERSMHVDTETISLLSAAKGIYLTETIGDMNINDLYNGTGEAVLRVAEPDAWLNISEGTVDGRMLWTADNMLVENLVHDGNEEELYFEVRSSSGSMADDVTINYQSDKKVRFGNLEAKHAVVLGDVNDLRFEHILTGEWGLFSNDTTSVFVDNTNGGLRKEYTIQLTSQFEPYFLTLTPPDRRKIETDAYALYYDEDWVTNSFSRENSLSRLTQKEMLLLLAPIHNQLSLSRRVEDKDLVEIDVDAVSLVSTDDSLLSLPPELDNI